MRRAQIMRRGRVGETNQARDMATEGWNEARQGEVISAEEAGTLQVQPSLFS
jgi:hypothetical protein